MTQSFINSDTLQPSRFGELYTDRDLKIFGEARWVAASNVVQTQDLSILVSAKDGGSTVVNEVPNLTYSLPANGDALWVRINRSSVGSPYTLVNAVDLVVYSSGSQPKPSENWFQLFIRHDNEIITCGGFVLSNSSQYTKIGFTRSSDYDLIVGPVNDPRATHFDIQAAVNEAVDGNRILILEGDYTLSAIVSVSGKTLTIEGEGWNSRIINGAALANAFTLVSASASVNASEGNGSRIIGLRLQGFNSSVSFNAATFGIRNSQVDVWLINGASYVAPTVVGTGVSENNNVVENVYSAALTPNYSKFIYNVSSSSDGTLIKHSTQENFDNRLRVGSAANTGRFKLPAYTTANRNAATGLEAGELFWDSDTETLEARSASGFVSFAPLPVGTIIALGGTFASANNVGAYVSAPNPPVNYKLCDGTLIADAKSIFNTRYVPLLTDDRFLQGHTSGGPLSNTPNDTGLAHTHTMPAANLAHTHTISHTHPVTVNPGPAFASTGNIPAPTVTGAGPASSHSHPHPHVHNMGIQLNAPGNRYWAIDVNSGINPIGVGDLLPTNPVNLSPTNSGLISGGMAFVEFSNTPQIAYRILTTGSSSPVTSGSTFTPHTHPFPHTHTIPALSGSTGAASPAASGAASFSVAEPTRLTGSGLSTFDRRPKYLSVKYYLRIF